MRLRSIALGAWLVCTPLATGIHAQAPAAHAEEDTTSPKLRISWDEFKKLHDSGKLVVVDVRSAAAFEAGHIPGPRSVPLEQVEKRVAELKKLKRPIVTYCA